MATYYVRKTGNNASAGTSAGAAWLTIGKALGASGIASGDTVYVGAGVYREQVTVAMTSATAETLVVADVEGQYTGDAGEVRWTARTTNDKTAAGAVYLCDLNGRDHLTFRRFVLEGGESGCIDAATTVTSTNCKFQDCTFFTGTGGASYDNLIRWSNTGGTAATWTVERCVFVGANSRSVHLDSIDKSGGADYDIGFTIRNCLFVGGPHTGVTGSSEGAVYARSTLGGTGLPGGLVVQNCTSLVGGMYFLYMEDSFGDFSNSIPFLVKNNFLVGGGIGSSGMTGTITEDYNLIVSGTPRTSVTGGGSTQTGTAYAPLVHVGQELQQLRLPRPFGCPTVDSPLLGFGNDTSPTALTTDFLNRPKPSGGGPTWASASKAVGYLELHDFGVKETTTVDAGSSIKVAGPGDIELQVPVDAVSTTITIKDRFDGSYGGGTKPQVTLVANGEIGVATQTVTDTGSSGAWNTITLAAFTPTAKGWVTLRLISNSAGSGNVYWDTVSVT